MYTQDNKPTLLVEASATIAAPAAEAYRLIADYHSGHPRIVPPKYFRNLTVIKGGYGAGTEISFEMRVFGTTQRSRAVVTEPVPGRVLVETDAAGRAVTTFTVEGSGDRASQVTIRTVMPTRGGVLGAIERAITRPFLRKVYAEELARLDAVARDAPPNAGN